MAHPKSPTHRVKPVKCSLDDLERLADQGELEQDAVEWGHPAAVTSKASVRSTLMKLGTIIS